MTSTTLPDSFFLYIASRHSATNPFSGYILIDAVKNGNQSWTLTPRTATYGEPWTVQKHANSHVSEIIHGFIRITGPDNILLNKRISRVYNYLPSYALQIQSPDGTAYPVYSMHKHTTVFGSTRLKQNVPLQWLPSPSAGDPSPAASIVHVVSQVPPTPVKKAPVAKAPVAKAPVATAKVAANGDLQPYVAKQLLTLAQLKKEVCPIVAEEFITGNTAVMPCGHLFMQMAIEESFKKEPNKCPWCRQVGRPTFV